MALTTATPNANGTHASALVQLFFFLAFPDRDQVVLAAPALVLDVDALFDTFPALACIRVTPVHCNWLVRTNKARTVSVVLL